MDCYCDYTPASVYWPSRPIARKPHRCEECGREIRRGERYERVRGIWDGHPDTFCTCVYCLAIRDLIEARAKCWCWEHGNMIEQAMDWLRDDDTPGIHMAAGRLIIEAKRDRQGV